MSLPSDFKTAEEYFYETVNFLNEFQWIFRNSNTQFIADGTIKDIPPEWIDCFLNMSLQEINCLPLGCINVNMKQFSSQISFLFNYIFLVGNMAG